MNTRSVVMAMALAVALAGCAGDGERPMQVVTIDSEPINLNGTAPAEPPQVPSDGGVAGVVVDQAIRPIAGATVTVPGLDRSTRTGPDGTFGFANLPAGGLFLRAEHEDHEANGVETVIQKGEIATVRIVLQAVLREPFAEVRQFEGYQELSGNPVFGFHAFTCPACTFTFPLREGAEALVIEGASERGATDPTGMFSDRRFYWTLDADGTMVESGYAADPFRINWTHWAVLDAANVEFSAYPTDMVPQQAVSFQIVTASFHNGADPEAWSVQEGRA